jgi:hypothetical protein
MVGMNYNVIYSQQDSNTTLFFNPEQKEIYIDENFLIIINVSTDAEIFAAAISSSGGGSSSSRGGGGKGPGRSPGDPF